MKSRATTPSFFVLVVVAITAMVALPPVASDMHHELRRADTSLLRMTQEEAEIREEELRQQVMEQSRTPLMRAFKYRNDEEAQRLLERGGVRDVNAVDLDGRSTLMYALEYATIERMQQLFELSIRNKVKIDVNYVNQLDGQSTLFYAFLHAKSKEHLQLLMEYSIQTRQYMIVNYVDQQNGDTLLGLALLPVDDGEIKMLLDYSSRTHQTIDVNYVNKWTKKSLFKYALMLGRTETLLLLIHHPSFEVNRALNKKGETALMLAMSVDGGNVNVVRALLELPSIDLRKKSNEGKTIEQYASDCNNSKIKELLAAAKKRREKEERIDELKNQMHTKSQHSLVQTLFWEEDEKARRLIAKGDVGDLNALDMDGRSALMYALEYATIERMQQLFELSTRNKMKIDVNYVHQRSGQSTLMYALLHAKSKDHLQLLMDYSIQTRQYMIVNYVNPKNGNTLFGFALNYVQLLLDYSSRTDQTIDVNYVNQRTKKSTFTDALMLGRTETLLLLIHHPSFEVNRALNKKGETALMLAMSVDGGNVNVVRALLELPGIDLRKKSNEGKTIEQYASNCNYSEIKELLAAAILREKSRREAWSTRLQKFWGIPSFGSSGI